MTPEQRARELQDSTCPHSSAWQFRCSICIAAAIRAAVEEAIEMCAQIVDERRRVYEGDMTIHPPEMRGPSMARIGAAVVIADLIRARKEQP